MLGTQCCADLERIEWEGGVIRNFPRTHDNWVCVAPTPTPRVQGGSSALGKIYVDIKFKVPSLA